MSTDHSLPLPMPADTWERLAGELKLSPTHKQIVELMLRNLCDKQIESHIGMPHSTLRTHIDRIFRRHRVEDRQDLILLLFAMAHGIRRH